MNFKNIQQYIQNIGGSLHFESFTGRGVINPNRDWKLLLLFFAILNGIVVLLSVYLFFQINKGEIFLVESQSSASVNIINETLLNETLLMFNEKAGAFEDVQTMKPTLPDPSR